MLNTFWKQKQIEPLEDLITSLELTMLAADPESDQYSLLLAHLERLTQMKVNTKPSRVSRDTLFIVAGNIVGIVIMVGYERFAVMGSKATMLLHNPKPQLDRQT